MKTTTGSTCPTYDAVVIGGGPAGLSAALQLARFNRQVAVFDSGMGRSTFQQITNNYPGFPGGIAARELRELMRKQVRMYPVAFLEEAAVEVVATEGLFTVSGSSGETIVGRSVILATGVRDDFPDVPRWEEYVGRSIFWCIVCDGYSTRGKRIVIVGNDDEGAVTAMQFIEFTNRIALLTNSVKGAISPSNLELLRRHGIRVVEGQLDGLIGNDGILLALEVRGDRPLEADFLFSLQGSSPNSGLAKTLGVKLKRDGAIVVDAEQQTGVPGVFAAGDVTGHLSHQFVTAAHEGITAATSAAYYLYEPWQRHQK